MMWTVGGRLGAVTASAGPDVFTSIPDWSNPVSPTLF